MIRLVTGPRLSDAIAAPQNGFSVLRLALALAVVVSHAFSVVTGRVLDEPLVVRTGFTLGEHAVNGFFAVSGFLVTMSFLRRGPKDYAIARALRIAPGFVVATLLVGLALGASLTVLPARVYLAEGAPWRFVLDTLTRFKTNVALPGLFPDNPLRLPLGTVWTLKYEAICYAGLFALGLLGALRHPRALVIALAGLALALVATEIATGGRPGAAETALRLVFLFAAGGCLYVNAARVRLSWALCGLLLLLAWSAAGTPLYRPLLFSAEAYGVLVLALTGPLARPVFDLRQDLSYGVYLYGWPIQQSLRHLWPGASVAELLGPSLLLTLAVAALSWILVERPALRLKARRLGPRPAGAPDAAS